MDGQIISRLAMFNRGVSHYVAGRARDQHNMNHHAAALPDYLAGWDAAAKAHADHQMAERRKQVAA
jgi:hypothetical protein